MPFDATTSTAPKLRPGERLLHGQVYVFDMGLRKAALADEAVENAPEDLSGLSDEEVTDLYFAWQNRNARKPFDALTIEVGDRVCAEHSRRHAAAFAGGLQ